MPKNATDTGSSHLHRRPFFNDKKQLDIDIPDGDVELGKKLFATECSGCHQLYNNNSLAPRLHNVFGKTAGTQKGFKGYSYKNRALGYQWSKQRLYYLIQNPQEVLGYESNMTFNGLRNRYDRVCLIEYLHFMRIHTSQLVKPEWINKN